jgi:protein TonB
VSSRLWIFFLPAAILQFFILIGATFLFCVADEDAPPVVVAEIILLQQEKRESLVTPQIARSPSPIREGGRAGGPGFREVALINPLHGAALRRTAPARSNAPLERPPLGEPPPFPPPMETRPAAENSPAPQRSPETHEMIPESPTPVPETLAVEIAKPKAPTEAVLVPLAETPRSAAPVYGTPPKAEQIQRAEPGDPNAGAGTVFPSNKYESGAGTGHGPGYGSGPGGGKGDGTGSGTGSGKGKGSSPEASLPQRIEAVPPTRSSSNQPTVKGPEHSLPPREAPVPVEKPKEPPPQVIKKQPDPEPKADPSPPPEITARREPAPIEKKEEVPPTRPALLSLPSPAYPRELREEGITGSVRVCISVSRDGRPSSVSITRSSGHPSMDSAALDAARRARFSPATKNGSPVESRITITIRFNIR